MTDLPPPSTEEQSWDGFLEALPDLVEIILEILSSF